MSNVKKPLNIPEKIRLARTAAGLSQKQLAISVGLTDKAISSYEKGRAMPPVDVLREISLSTYKPMAFFLDETSTDEANLQMKLEIIERELSEIRKLLQKKGEQSQK